MSGAEPVIVRRPRPHENLETWKAAIDLTANVYKLTEGFPREERFGLVAQARSAAVSVPANISEGAARGSRKEYIRFLSIARGSLSELETHLYLSERLEYLSASQLENALMSCSRLDRMIQGLSAYQGRRSRS